MTPGQAMDSYRRALTQYGEVVTLRRMVPNQPSVDLVQVRARITGYEPEEIVGGIDAGSRKAILLAEDLADVDPPVRKNDRLVLGNGSVLVVASVDGSTRKIGSMVIAYECEVTGSAL